MFSNNTCTFLLLFGIFLTPSPLFSQQAESIRNMRIKTQEIHQKEWRDGKWKIIRYSKSQFDKKGNTLSNVEFGLDSTFKLNEKITYNSHHEPIEYELLDQDGKTIKKTQTFYNHVDQKVEERNFNGQNQLISITKFEYDQFGHKILEVEYNETEQEKTRIQYDYNKYGSLVLKRIYEEGKCIYEKKYEYQYY